MSEAPSTPSTPAPSVGTTATADAQTSVSPSQEVAQESAEVAQPTPPTQEQIKEAVKKWKLKSGKNEREVQSEDELVRLAQLGLGAHEKFEQAANTRKKAEAILELFQKDPAKALSSLGHDVRKMAEDYLVNEAKKQMLSPEEKQKLEIQQEIEKLKAEREELAKQQREERISQLQAKYEVDIQDKIINAIDQYKLPKNPKVVARIAEYMASALENGYEINPADVAPRVRADLEQEHKDLYSQYSVEDLIRILGGDSFVNKIRQYDVQRVKAKAPPAPTKTESVPLPSKGETEEKPKKKMTMSDFQEELDKYLK